jgi:hypothetical protein
VNKSKQPIANLAIITGVMLILFAVPIGIETTFLVHHVGHLEWHWSILGGGIMAIVMALLGSTFLSIGNFFVKRRWKEKTKAN